MSRRHRDEDRNKEFHVNLAKASITDMKKEDYHRSCKSPDGDNPASPKVMSDNQRAIRTYDKGPASDKTENKHSPIGSIVRRKRDPSTERNRLMSDEESVSSSSSSSSRSSCSSSPKRDKKRKRSSSSRKRRRKEEKRRHKASKKKKKKRSKSRDSESSTDDEDEANVRRSAITGRRIKMHVDKDAGDLVLEKARKDFLRYVNSSL